ncbi:MAG: type I DNA topoisomerase [Clostridia bacterium]|nr:type I DNA topoisomerase [Clostridia bacterium]
MATNLVILESPGKIGTVKNYLGSNYKVIASVGHVRDLPKSSLGIDIDNNFETHYINIRGKGDLIKDLKKEAKKADKIFFATDPDREGEAISWHLSAVLGEYSKKAKRISFNEITKSAVKEAIKHPRDIDMDLVNSQQARRLLDRIVGYKVSPILWKSVKSGLSAGRVQSVATKIIVEREREIQAFKPTEYWTIDAVLSMDDKKTVEAHFYGNKTKKIKIKNQKEADAILEAVKGNPFNVYDIKKGTKSRAPMPPFTTSTLQQDAARKLGFQSQKTMKIAQELYEGIDVGAEHGGVQGLITYMRTDSLRISEEAQAKAKDLIISKYGEKFYPSKTRIYKSKSNAQDAHEAIRPSNVELEPQLIRKRLSNDQYKLYKLIWERFVASQMSSAVINTVVVDFENNGHIFRSSGYTVAFSGYMTIYEEANEEAPSNADDAFDPEKNAKIPAILEKDVLTSKSIEAVQHFTEPPLRYDEATLVKFLEENGIGRPSTFTPIITVIITRGYVARDGKFLKPTPLGEVTTKIMDEYFPDVMDYKFTAIMENRLDTIASGKEKMQEVLSDFYKQFEIELENAEKAELKNSTEILQERAGIICDKCGSEMIVKNGRFGKFAACSNYPKCKNTKTLNKDGSLQESKKAETADFKCEICGSDVVVRTGQYGDFYACSNYPNCKFTKAKIVKIGVKCPKCGEDIVSKVGKSGKQFFSCLNYPKCNFSTWDMPTNEKCTDCGSMLLRKKNGTLMCSVPKCRYKTKDSKND